MDKHTLLRALIVFLVVTSLGAPLAVAQEDTESESESDDLDEYDSDVVYLVSENGTAEDATNTTANQTDDEDGDGEDDSGIFPSFPSGSELLQDIMEWMMEDISEGLEDGIDKLHFVLVGLPAPGEYDDPSTWVPPENDPWPYVFSVFGLSSGISIILLVFATQYTMGMKDLKRKRESMRQIGRAFIVGPVLGFPIVAMALHAGNGFTMALSPSGQEFLMDYNVADLGFGFILGMLLIKFKLIIIFIGLAILVLVYFSILFLAAAWPALWAMRVVPIPTLQSWGTLGITAFGKLVIMRVLQAFLLRFTFELPWGSIGSSEFFISVLGTAVGLLVALVILPWIVLRKVTIASAVGLGMAGVSMNAVSEAPGRVRSGTDRVRSRISEVRSTSPPREVGNVHPHAYTRSSSTRQVGSFGGSGRSSSSRARPSRPTKQRGYSSGFQRRRTADRAAKSRSDD